VNSEPDGTTAAKRGTRPGSIRQVRLRLWWAITEATKLLDEPETETKLKAISALSTACGAYGNLTKSHTLEAELAALQKDLHDVRASIVGAQGASKRPAAPPVN
jgi:hypothetical protein